MYYCLQRLYYYAYIGWFTLYSLFFKIGENSDQYCMPENGSWHNPELNTSHGYAIIQSYDFNIYINYIKNGSKSEF